MRVVETAGNDIAMLDRETMQELLDDPKTAFSLNLLGIMPQFESADERREALELRYVIATAEWQGFVLLMERGGDLSAYPEWRSMLSKAGLRFRKRPPQPLVRPAYVRNSEQVARWCAPYGGAYRAMMRMLQRHAKNLTKARQQLAA